MRIFASARAATRVGPLVATRVPPPSGPAGLEAQFNCLQLLSLGNNQLVTFDLPYLRKFKKLLVLNLDGNPACEESEYRSTTLAHLPGAAGRGARRRR